jgi:hypothetical protein
MGIKWYTPRIPRVYTTQKVGGMPKKWVVYPRNPIRSHLYPQKWYTGVYTAKIRGIRYEGSPALCMLAPIVFAGGRA